MKDLFKMFLGCALYAIPMGLLFAECPPQLPAPPQMPPPRVEVKKAPAVVWQKIDGLWWQWDRAKKVWWRKDAQNRWWIGEPQKAPRLWNVPHEHHPVQQSLLVPDPILPTPFFAPRTGFGGGGGRSC